MVGGGGRAPCPNMFFAQSPAIVPAYFDRVSEGNIENHVLASTYFVIFLSCFWKDTRRWIVWRYSWNGAGRPRGHSFRYILQLCVTIVVIVCSDYLLASVACKFRDVVVKT